MKLLTAENQRTLCFLLFTIISLVAICAIIFSTTRALPSSSLSPTSTPATTINVHAATFDNLLKRSPAPRGLEKRGVSAFQIASDLASSSRVQS